MLPARPRHFPSLSRDAERFAGSRGCGTASCPGRASPHHPGYFVLEGEARRRAGSWAPSEQAPVCPDCWATALTSTHPSLAGRDWGSSARPPDLKISSCSQEQAPVPQFSPDPQVPRIPPWGRSQDAGTWGREGLLPTRTARKSSSCTRGRDKCEEKEVADASGAEAPPSPRGHRSNRNGCRNQGRFIVKTQPPNT